MIDYQQAIEKQLHGITPLAAVTLPINQTIGMIAAKDIFSDEQVPAFHNSAMDGFAVCSQELSLANPEQAVTLSVIDTTNAGETCANVVTTPYSAWEIMTGAPLPNGYDAVIPVEQVEKITQKNSQTEKILIRQPIVKGANIRYAGEDYQLNDQVVKQGTVIQPRHIMALASVGIAEIDVIKKPRIALICTGKELSPDPAARLSASQIHNSNGPYLQALLPLLGTELCAYHLIDDQPKQFEALLQTLLASDTAPDIILTTGGVSAGRCDFIPTSLNKLGANTLFHKVRIRPGKPILFATLGDCYLLGLPGNPISAAVGTRFFLYPLLRRLLGLSTEPVITAHLTQDGSKKTGFRCFYKAKMQVTPQANVTVELLAGQESFKVNSLIHANCWAVLSEQQNHYRQDEIIELYPLLPLLSDSSFPEKYTHVK
ncbi:MAG: molybdopterin molybdotransferase MoeA [Gammaproteobacteria bacterium]|nr:molybdopterin molybdotransferase MoeA [Gammaproteobacteria bacterium]